MNTKFKILTIMSFCFVSVMAFAQDAKEEKKSVDVSGVIFANYTMLTAENRTAAQKNQKHGFEVERVYLNFRKDLGDNFSMRVTTDVGQGAAGSSDRGLIFLKYAYGEYKNNFSGIGVKATFGMIDNPVLALVDRLAGMRWLSRNQMDAFSIDNSADLGGSLDFNFFKIASLTVSAFNGEGYGRVARTAEAYKGKEAQGLLSITPIENLFINGFYAYEKSNPGKKESYMGGGLAWSDKLYKAGVNATMVTDSTRSIRMSTFPTDLSPSTSPDFGKGLYFDGWVNVNLSGLIGIPITLNGRFGYIMPDNDYEIKTLEEDYNVDSIMTFAFGPGFQFNNNVQFALWGQYEKVGERDANMGLYVKTELRF